MKTDPSIQRGWPVQPDNPLQAMFPPDIWIPSHGNCASKQIIKWNHIHLNTSFPITVYLKLIIIKEVISITLLVCLLRNIFKIVKWSRGQNADEYHKSDLITLLKVFIKVITLQKVFYKLPMSYHFIKKSIIKNFLAWPNLTYPNLT